MLKLKTSGTKKELLDLFDSYVKEARKYLQTGSYSLNINFKPKDILSMTDFSNSSWEAYIQKLAELKQITIKVYRKET